MTPPYIAPYDRLSPERQSRCRFEFFGDSSLCGHIADTGAIFFEYPTDRLSPMNVSAIIRELEKMPQDSRDNLNALLQSWGAKTRL